MTEIHLELCEQILDIIRDNPGITIGGITQLHQPVLSRDQILQRLYYLKRVNLIEQGGYVEGIGKPKRRKGAGGKYVKRPAMARSWYIKDEVENSE